MEKVEYDFDVGNEVKTIHNGKEIIVKIKYIGSDGYFNQSKYFKTDYVIAETDKGKEITIDPSQTTLI